MRLSAGRAVALGALHGPAELLPVSSSAHVALAAAGRLAPAEQKALEVALHAGTAPALLWLLRADALRALRLLDRRRVAFHALALAPPAVVGGLLERLIEERLGGPRPVAAGLAAGAAGLVAGERAGRRALRERGREDVGARDGLALGLAQAAALAPGVSRRGATLAAARARGFARAEASALSWEVALPVLAAATARKAARLLAAPPPASARRALAAGALASTLATLAGAPLLRAVERGPWWPYAAWRAALAALALGRRSRAPQPSARMSRGSARKWRRFPVSSGTL